MKLIKFTPDHHSIVSKWWEAQKWPVIPLEMLSKNGLLVETDDGRLACAGWLYSTDSKISWVEWIVANPDVRREERSKALDYLIETLTTTARVLGFNTLFSSVKHPLLIDRMQKHGFHVTDKNMSNMIGRV